MEQGQRRPASYSASTSHALNSNSANFVQSGPTRPAPAQHRGTRRYNASCDSCRARKRKCSGKNLETGEERCTTCIERGLKCTYGNLGEPSRLRRADLENQKLRAIISEMAEAITDDEKARVLSALETDSNASSSNKPDYVREALNHKIAGDKYSLKKRKVDEIDQAQTASQSSESKSPSAIGGAEFATATIASLPEGADGYDGIRERILGYINGILPGGLDQDAPTEEEQERLISYYFCWLNARYSLLDETLLKGSLGVPGSPFCSPFLLWSLFTHASSHCPGFLGRKKEFGARAHLLLTLELSSGKVSSLTTGQGLILLAGSAAAGGNHSQAWVLTHTAISITRELLDSIHTASPEEAQMRRRLYWATYIWSIILALNLNRRPPLPRLRVEPFSGDEEAMWTPVLPLKVDDDYSSTALLLVPTQKSYEMSCARQQCKLFGFLDDILQNVYAASEENQKLEEIYKSVKSIRDSMIAWQSQLPQHLLLDTDALPTIAPPPHIVHFNLLIRSTWILLYRPFYSMSSLRNPIAGARAACDECAREIHAISVLLERTYGVLRITYIFIYAAFWAATIDVAHAKREGLREDLLARLSYSSRILLSWVSLPGMRQSVSQLVSQIESLLLPQTLTGAPEQKQGQEQEQEQKQEATLVAEGSSKPRQDLGDGAPFVTPFLPQDPLSDIQIPALPDMEFAMTVPPYQISSEMYWTLPSWTLW